MIDTGLWRNVGERLLAVRFNETKLKGAFVIDLERRTEIEDELKRGMSVGTLTEAIAV